MPRHRDPVCRAVAREATLGGGVVARHVDLGVHGRGARPCGENGFRVALAQERTAHTRIRAADPDPRRRRGVERACVVSEGVGEVNDVFEGLIRGKELPLLRRGIFLDAMGNCEKERTESKSRTFTGKGRDSP